MAAKREVKKTLTVDERKIIAEIEAKAREVMPEIHGMILVLSGRDMDSLYTDSCCQEHKIEALEVAIEMLQERLARVVAATAPPVGTTREELH